MNDLTVFRESVMGLSREFLKLIAEDEWTMIQILIMGSIFRNGNEVTPSFISTSERMTSSNVASTLRYLEQHGLISKKKNLLDKRVTFISLTDKGIAVLKNNREKREAWLREKMEDRLCRDEISTLMKAGIIINKLISK